MGWDTKPKYTEVRKTIKGLEEGSNVVRILPPLHSCAKPGKNEGKWFFQHRQHFGYDTPRAEDPTLKDYNTFYCVEEYNFREKHIERACPECEKNKEVKREYESKKAVLKEAGKTPEQIQAALGKVAEYMKRHNLDNKYYINVKNKDGTFSTRKIPWTAYKKVRAQIDELLKPTNPRRAPVDPIAPDQGVWFDIIRTGKSFNEVDYDVKVVTEPREVVIDGETKEVEVLVKAPLTEEEYERAEGSCYDISDVGIRRLPYDKVVALVASHGSPEEIRAIFGSSERREVEPVEVEEPTPVVEEVEVKAQRLAPGPTIKPQRMVEEITVRLDDAGVGLPAPTPVEKANAKALVEAATKPAPAVATPDLAGVDILNMSLDDFRAKFGVK